MLNSLEERKIVVTGAAGVLGAAVVQALVRRGARVAAVDLAVFHQPANQSIAQYPGVDLNDSESVISVLRQASQWLSGKPLGGIDSLVNVAGGFAWENLEGGALATWDRLYTANLRSAVVASQAAVAHLLEKGMGSVVNVGAWAAVQADAGMGAYAASKSGVMRLTEAMAQEFKNREITVNAVLPSIIDTPANREAMPEADVSRWVSPDAVARVIAFLVSDDARAITGASIPVIGRM